MTVTCPTCHAHFIIEFDNDGAFPDHDLTALIKRECVQCSDSLWFMIHKGSVDLLNTKLVTALIASIPELKPHFYPPAKGQPS